MSSGPTNQEGALALWRADAARDDPPLYAVQTMLGARYMWLSVQGNIGWYRPVSAGGEVVELHSIAAGGHDSLIKYLSHKQRRKIAVLLSP